MDISAERTKKKEGCSTELRELVVFLILILVLNDEKN